jgi:hypothetical protein
MWVFLQYLLGFRKLGFDVLYVDALEPDQCVDFQRRPCGIEESWNVRYFGDVMNKYGLADCWTLLAGKHRTLGASREKVADFVREAECVIHVMGFLRHDELLGQARQHVFLDIDPGFGQMWRTLGLADIFDGHDHYLTVGLNVGETAFLGPTCGLTWIPTPPPVVLDMWPKQPTGAGKSFTSVCTWRGVFGPIDYQGRTYGLRVHEFRKFYELPRLSRAKFELALDIDRAETRDLDQLHSYGWQLVDPEYTVQSPQSYRDYIQRSFAEFGVAKNLYVETRGGWVSDRTVCYLASGKPALVQDTGLRDKLPTHEGLVVFNDLNEARRGVERICTDYERHCQAARRIAEEHFDSDKVLPRMLRAIGLN